MVVVSVPSVNGLGKTNGCEKASKIILDFFEKEFGKVLDYKEIFVKNDNLEFSNKEIYEKSFEVYRENKKSIFLGGDHSISYPLTRAFFDFCEYSGKSPSLIVFDAHADCDNPNKEPTHEEWLRKLIEDGFPPENILLVGLRKVWKNELDFLKEKKVKIIFMERFLDNFQELLDIITEFSNGRPLYVSIDIDVIDPVFAPATGYPEEGGFSSREFLYIVKRINKVKNLKAIDIVEINPLKDFQDKTIKLTTKILKEFI